MKLISYPNAYMILFTNVLLMFKVESKVFGIINNMERLVRLQKDVIENILPYIADVPESNRSAITKYINSNKKENSRAMKNVTLFLANPVNCYVLVKRLSRDLSHVEYILEQYTDYERNESLINFPTDVIFQAAIAQIVLLVYIYDIKAHDFASGMVTGNFRRDTEMFTAASTLMTSGDCYEVALTAFQYKKYQMALDWLNEAFLKYHDDCQDDCPFTESDIVRDIRRIHFFLERLDYSIERFTKEAKVENINELLKYDDNIINRITAVLRKTKDEGLLDIRKSILTKWDAHQHIRYLCQKEHKIQDNRLHCQYRYGPHPFLRLARFKMELLYIDPEIIFIHEAISDKEIESLQYITDYEIKYTNKTYEGSLSVDEMWTLRHMVQIKDKYSKVTTVLTQRSMDISGLIDIVANGIRVADYGVTGFHAPHRDSSASLTEPDLGGATTFEKIGMSVFPVKNSALYWRTLSPSGVENLDTVHASCPLMHGTKWVAVKWLSLPQAMESPEFLRNFDEDISKKSPFTPLSNETLKRIKLKGLDLKTG